MARLGPEQSHVCSCNIQVSERTDAQTDARGGSLAHQLARLTPTGLAAVLARAHELTDRKVSVNICLDKARAAVDASLDRARASAAKAGGS